MRTTESDSTRRVSVELDAFALRVRLKDSVMMFDARTALSPQVVGTSPLRFDAPEVVPVPAPFTRPALPVNESPAPWNNDTP
ncbi:hypothetical protein D3C80_1912710 [compost metagenome]